MVERRMTKTQLALFLKEQGMKTKEIARELETSPESVRVLLFKARRAAEKEQTA